jgi:protein-disulfide isomerase
MLALTLGWSRMPSGKQSKRQRRAAATAVRGKEGRQASPRVLAAGAALLALIAVGVLLGVVLSGGPSKTSVPARGTLVDALPGAAEVQRLLEGIPQHGNVLGSPAAPVTLVEYVDLQCPYCREFETEAMTALVSRYVGAGKLKVELRPLAFIGPDSVRGRAAVIAAGRQNKLFELTQLLYLNQGTENTGWLDDGMVKSAAASIPGLDVPLLLDSRSSAATDARARRFDGQAAADAVTGTPTILVGKSRDTLRRVTLASPTDEHAVVKAVEAALR